MQEPTISTVTTELKQLLVVFYAFQKSVLRGPIANTKHPSCTKSEDSSILHTF